MTVQIINPLLGLLAFDATTEVVFAPSNRVTEHPVEDGSQVNDHIQADPTRFIVRGVITSSPWLGTVNAVRFDPMREAEDFLERSRLQTLIVVTPENGTFSNMALVRWGYAYSLRKSRRFEVEFKQINIATVGIVSIPATQPAAAQAAGFPDQVDVGPQATTSTVTVPGQSGQTTSVLASLVGGLGG